MSKVKLSGVKNSVLKTGNHYITLDYGNTYSDGSFHKGIDLVASSESGKGGDYILAFADGKVTSYKNSFTGTTNESTTTASMGNYVIIDHGNGFKTRYMHMLKGSVKVKTGDVVKKGQVIGYMGNTGNSFGRHLHFDISYNTKEHGGHLSNSRYYLDPKPYLKGEKSMSKTEKPEKDDYPSYIVTVKTVLNVRTGPGTNYKVIKTLDNKTVVKVYEIRSGWAKISKTAEQWVMLTYLKKI